MLTTFYKWGKWGLKWLNEWTTDTREELTWKNIWNKLWAGIPSLVSTSHCSVAHLCPTLSDPMDCSMPGFPVLHHLPELAKIHVHCVSNAIQLSHPLSSPFPPAFNLSQLQGHFQISQFFLSSDQSIGASASASDLPMNIQDWFPLRLTGLISLQSKGLSRVFSNTTVQRHQLFNDQPSLWSNSCFGGIQVLCHEKT